MGVTLDVQSLDVASPDSIARCVDAVHARHGRIDVLVNNAGASTDVFATYGQSGADIAAIILDVARAESPNFRYVTSEFARTIVQPKVVDYTGNNVVDAFAARLG